MRKLSYGVDYFVYLVELPWGVYGTSEANEDGTYTILINSRYTVERQEITLVHEILHCSLGHFDRDQEDKSRAEKEYEVKCILKQLRAS